MAYLIRPIFFIIIRVADFEFFVKVRYGKCKLHSRGKDHICSPYLVLKVLITIVTGYFMSKFLLTQRSLKAVIVSFWMSNVNFKKMQLESPLITSVGFSFHAYSVCSRNFPSNRIVRDPFANSPSGRLALNWAKKIIFFEGNLKICLNYLLTGRTGFGQEYVSSPGKIGSSIDESSR